MHISNDSSHRLSSVAPWKAIRRAVPLAAVAVILGASSLAAQEEGGDPAEAEEAAAAANTTQGVFSEEQATRGEDVFWNICAECHFEEDFGGPFIQSWAGASVKDLVDEIVATMPEDNPGGMPMEQYVDVVAYMFKINGMPTGEDELTAENVDAVEIALDLDP
ncbi:MAG: cytochrome c [Gemmatimonadales bacterium]|uniref:c-type cytochrome n=1 Tax=Candidatus Palauibacter irciniicola TaxID=3056733 RepID=UPI0013865B3A|nr:cytochrome c [Candidatus Palauibacter irciniicola]MYC17188.1 cytochrome c [Gemmatimonadales bacterium]